MLDQQFSAFCEMEFNDSIADASTQMSREDRRAMEMMEQSIKLVDGHYRMDLPWRAHPSSLPENKPLAEHRLKGPLSPGRLCALGYIFSHTENTPFSKLLKLSFKSHCIVRV